MPRISKHFYSEEFGQPARHGLKAKPYPQEWIASRLGPLCKTLECIRRELRQPIKILSGYRSPEYNSKIGGARRSQHMAGTACDFVVGGVSVDSIQAVIFDLYRHDELPLLGGLGFYPNFVHVDVRGLGKRRLARWTGSRSS